MRRTARKPDDERWLTLGVGSVGATSFLSDTGHEMVTAILPSFLTTVLGGSAAVLGIIDGVSDALTGVTKLVGGPLADDPARRPAMARGGYVTTALATAAIGLAMAVWQVGVLRGISWAARGFRSPARDSMLASLAPTKAFGRAFGVERVGDNFGAVIGPLLAGLLVGWIGMRPTIWISVIPGLLAAAAITVAARQVRRGRPNGEKLHTRLFAHYGQLRGTGIVRALIPAALFEGGNLAATLLILRANELLVAGGVPLAAAIGLTTVLYAAHNAAAAGMSAVAGSLVDRIGPRGVLAGGAAVYVIAYAGFAAGPLTWWGILIFFVLGGCGIGLAETAESALVARALPDNLRGTGFGLLGVVQAGGDLTATVVGGILYTVISPVACFVYAAAWMALSVGAAGFTTKTVRKTSP